ncbi:MAG: hypothetical protein KF729_08240 [Sandaracinaceae bacterium]|nr:hypothetical protein [Sandaracinaceae bacterium]
MSRAALVEGVSIFAAVAAATVVIPFVALVTSRWLLPCHWLPYSMSGCCGSHLETARTRAAALRSAATLAQAQDPGGGCPTLKSLALDGSLQDQDWHKGQRLPARIECRRGTIVIHGPGLAPKSADLASPSGRRPTARRSEEPP